MADRRHPARKALAEVVVFVDVRRESRLIDTLHQRIDAALWEAGLAPDAPLARLPGRVRDLAARFGMRFYFIFDGFEALLGPPPPSDDAGQLLDELVRLLARGLPANMLVVMRSDAKAGLQSFVDRLQGIDPEVLELEPAADAAPPGDTNAAAAAPASPRRAGRLPARRHGARVTWSKALRDRP